MSRVQKLRVFVSQRMNAAVEEILSAFEKTIVKYEEEAALCQEVISRQHALLCALQQPHSTPASTDTFTQQPLVSDKHVPPEHLDQLDPPVKAEQEGEQLPDLDEADIIQFTYNSRCTVRPGEHVDRLSPAGTEPESAGADQDVQLVSSETEDSDDYSKDSTDTRSAPNRPKQKRRGRGVFSCRVCNRSFTASRFLFRHVEAHLQEAEPVCGLCGDRFEAAESLKPHIQTHRATWENQSRTRSREGRFHQNLQPDTNARVHRSKKPHTCDDCGETFLQVWKKKKHRCCHLRESQGSVEKTTPRTKT